MKYLFRETSLQITAISPAGRLISPPFSSLDAHLSSFLFLLLLISLFFSSSHSYLSSFHLLPLIISRPMFIPFLPSSSLCRLVSSSSSPCYILPSSSSPACIFSLIFLHFCTLPADLPYFHFPPPIYLPSSSSPRSSASFSAHH